MRIENNDSLNFLKTFDRPLSDKELKTLGEAHVNFLTKFIKKNFLPRPAADDYFINRGISIVKEHNLNFIRKKLYIADTREIEKHLPERILLGENIPTKVQDIHDYMKLKNKQKNISKFNAVLVENEKWMPLEEFGSFILKNIDRLNESKFESLGNLLQLVVANQNDKEKVVKAFLLLGDNLQSNLEFYTKNSSLFKNLIENIPSDITAEDLSNHLSNIEAWGTFFISHRATESEEAILAFLSELGPKYLADSNPQTQSAKINDIKKLFGFYTDAIQKENLNPDIFAKALKAFLQGKEFHKVVENLGS